MDAATNSSEMGTTECQEALEEIVECMQNRDMYNVLFTPERIERAYFEDPNAVKTGIAARFSSKRYFGEQVEQVQGHMLYVPCFTISNVHVGFGYHYHSRGGGKLNTKRAHARYVVDTERRSFISVLNGDDENLVICYKRFLSTTCHKRCTVWVEGRPEGGFEEWIRGARCVYSGLEFRKCVYCKLDMCDCEIIDSGAAHPFDDTGFREAVNGMMGKFRGIGRVESYSDGMLIQAIMTETELDVGICVNEAVIEELREMGCGGRKRGTSGTSSEIKAQLRKERNRASARKSNMKKKLMNDALKLAVKEEKQRVVILKGTEDKLRLKNLNLRRLLAER